MSKGRATTPLRVHKTTLRELAEAEISPQDREQLIAETAYYRALSRGFEGDEHLRDWFEAEKIVDDMLRKAATNQSDIIH